MFRVSDEYSLSYVIQHYIILLTVRILSNEKVQLHTCNKQKPTISYTSSDVCVDNKSLKRMTIAYSAVSALATFLYMLW